MGERTRRQQRWDIVVVGGSVAGARTAGELAASGAQVLIVDPQPLREKACGGWLPTDIASTEPLLVSRGLDVVAPHRLRVVAPAGQRESTCPGYLVTSRLDLNRLLFAWAREQGARHRSVAVRDLARRPDGFELKLSDDTQIHCDLLVGADGALSRVRQSLVGTLGRDRLWMTLGLTLPGSADCMSVHFTEGWLGYGWCLPRRDHRSLGLCTPARGNSGLRRELARLARQVGAPSDLQPWSAPIPMITEPGFWRRGLCGPRWLLVGDAAGLTNAVTGEGIAPALRSAQLAAEAILRGRVQSYRSAAQGELEELVEAATMMREVLADDDPARAYRRVALPMLCPILGARLLT